MLTHEEKQLRKILVFFGFCFIVAGLGFLLGQNHIIYFLNEISYKILPHSKLINPSSEKFWLVLTLSMMMMITTLSFSAASEIRRKKDYCIYILLSKITSTFFFILFYFTQEKIFAYLLGAIVDGSIFIILLIFYKRAQRSSLLR